MRTLLLVGAALILGAGATWYLRETPSVVPVADLRLCGEHERNTDTKTCIIDGDTLWLQGVNIRLKDFDTPESQRNVCSGFDEIDLARRATDRLQELLKDGTWTIQLFGMDNAGHRRLGTITVGDEDVGDILIRER